MKKKIIIGSLIVLSLAIIGGGAYCIYSNNTDKPEEIKCEEYTGGSYTLSFDVNGGSELGSMGICIACSPDSYATLPTPTKKGYKFDGWYYDSELTNKVDVTSTGEISPIEDLDKNNCRIGYKEIKLYAKWIKK